MWLESLPGGLPFTRLWEPTDGWHPFPAPVPGQHPFPAPVPRGYENTRRGGTRSRAGTRSRTEGWHPFPGHPFPGLHGGTQNGTQNAHTWDTVALALDRPLVVVDLPGHGHSDWRDDHDYVPERDAEAVATALAEWAPRARVVVGMSTMATRVTSRGRGSRSSMRA